MKKNILLVCGGDGSEHEISLISADFIYQKLCANSDFNVIKVCLTNNEFVDDNNNKGYFDGKGGFNINNEHYQIAALVPCIHGIPAESGEFQGFLELNAINYIGCDMQASINCFNKITTKLYLNAIDIPNTPFLIINDKSDNSIQKACEYFNIWKDVYIKAACQGSSIGCYHVTDSNDLKDSIYEAFSYSHEVLMEKTIVHRELEVAAFEINGELIISDPGEIIMPSNEFYTFEQKYAQNSKTTTTTEPANLSDETIHEIKEHAYLAFKALKLRDLSRIDFFLSDDGEVLLNEINTFPGMTPISMFPKLLEASGYDMTEFLTQCIDRAYNRNKAKKII